MLAGKYLGINASTVDANAATKSIVHRDTGESYAQMLERLAEASGIKTSIQAKLVASHRKRKGKWLSNKDWQSATDEESCIVKLKDGRTHMAYKRPTSLSTRLIWNPGPIFLQ